MDKRIHYKLQRKVTDLFSEDHAAMNNLPKYEFDPCKFIFAKTNKYGYVKFDNNSYSTAGNYAGKEVVLKVSAMHISVLDDKSNALVTHPRLYGKGKESTIWAPYLTLIAQRPMALKYTGFYNELPEKTRDFFNRCDIQERKKALHFLAGKSEISGYANAIAAIDKAILLGAKDTDSLISGYRYITDPKLPEITMSPHPYFPKTAGYKVDLDVYMDLIPEVHHV